jgi:hypothetical protein
MTNQPTQKNPDNKPGITKVLSRGREKAAVKLLAITTAMGGYIGKEVGSSHRESLLKNAGEEYEVLHPFPEVPKALQELDMRAITDGALEAAANLEAVKAKGIGKKILGQIIEEYYVVWKQLPSDNSEVQNSIRKQRALFDAANLDAARKSGIGQELLKQVISTYETVAANLTAEQEKAIAERNQKILQVRDEWRQETAKAMAAYNDELGFSDDFKGAAYGAAWGSGAWVTLLLGGYFVGRRRAKQQSTPTVG